MPAVFNNRTVQVLQQITQKSAKAARAMAEDVVKVSNPRTPYKRGGLRNQRRIEQKGESSYDIHWSSPYAEYQDRGSRRDGSHVIRRHTTPGTGSGFVEKGLNYVKKNYKGYFK